MRTRLCLAWLLVILPLNLAAQQQWAMSTTPSELGKWWKNSQIVKQLQLKESQVNQIEQIFMGHQNKLVSAKAELDKSELQLKQLMQAEPVQESQAQKAIEQVAKARSELEKVNASMLLSIRMTLSKEQWNKLDTIQNSKKTLILAPVVKSASGQNLPPGLKAMQFEDGMYSVNDPSIKPPQVIQQPKPPYTQKARDARVQGIVLVNAVIQKDGRVGQIRVIKGLGYGLDENVVDTLSKQWKFMPGTLNNEPVNVSVVIEVSFRLY
ncbi:MAG TPA: TonB family protein [Acidobacteriota bacterium]|nr:TonB family protein [Acidobacteriota bacterium]